MSCPITSVINPLNPAEILLFYLDDKGTTGLERHSFQNNQYNPTKFADNGVADVDVIANPGAFSALTSGGLLNVYGFVKAVPPNVSSSSSTGTAASSTTASTSSTTTKAPVDADASKRIAQLSPVYKLLTTDTWGEARGVALATTIDDDGQGWLYYIGIKNNNTVINEVKLSWNQSTLNYTINGNAPLLATNLAAAYDPKLKKRLVVYQNADTLRIIESSIDGTDAAVPNTGDSQDSTGIALVPVKSQTGVKLYLYYFASKKPLLQRIIRDENGKWEESGAVGPAKQAAKTTFLTATQVAGKIVLFYVASDDSKNIYVYQDAISE